MRWQLDSLYQDFDAKYDKDIEEVKKLIESFDQMTKNLNGPVNRVIGDYLELITKIKVLAEGLKTYPYLRSTMNAGDAEAKSRLENIELVMTDLTGPMTRFKYWLKEADVDLESLDAGQFHIKELLEKSHHMMSEKEENLFAQMNLVAGESWGKLQKTLTSSLTVSINIDGEDQVMPLTVASKYLSHADMSVREKAFKAIQEAFETIDKSVALSLSNIKRQGNMMAKARDFASVLDEMLFISRMSRETLDALMSSIEAYLPVFRKYLKAKSLYLGDGEKIKLYNFSAPVGGIDKTYTVDQAKTLVLDSFNKFSLKLGSVARTAFDDKWVDFEPRSGKRGGAFCYNLPYIGQSRVSLNFNGDFSNVITLAHELGHAYHGSVIQNNAAYDWTYPMPLAETASTFCEQVIGSHLMATISEDEKLYILEMNAMKATRLMIDIISRYWFEDQVIKEAKANTLSVDRVKTIMKEAQLKAYGDAVDPDFLDPYAWVSKPHYYYLDRHYYNFPYSFGFLYAKGLYGMFNENPDAFLDKFDDMLAQTTKASIEDVGKIMGVDLSSKDFWINSLENVKADIEEVCKMLDNYNRN
ncbi:M3 family oligoendopeptidase [Acidaminobacter sp. JC074]|uniref:M3 family oligoendopeptidase n=1 Tax=Acidaminobacter sp. JC074 TaxID=2530199 RepID=UPI001F105DFB|nr:M3 family oligoendopeptidase [Acidaminobacter sp. JC074]MCH4891136.1 M3 family oligoendopeptidase [Acidaminobacter sp. JC074]